MNILDYISEFESIGHRCEHALPWDFCGRAKILIPQFITELGPDYAVDKDRAIHKSAIIEQGVTIKGPVIIGKDCVVSAHSYFREGVFLGEGVTIGPSCEIKASWIFSHSALAHLNYVGNSLIGSDVNLEAGVVLANHFNERRQKNISILDAETVIETGVAKFGALVGDGTKIGANAVTTPGTILKKQSIVSRLTLVNQLEQFE
ncbi:MAG: LpxA family transferase [bacterium]|nr:LpxA family transferase [bacterium]